MTYAETVEKLPIVSQSYESFTSALLHNKWRRNYRVKGDQYDAWEYIEHWMSPKGQLIITQRWKKTDGWDYYLQTEHSKIHDCIVELGLEARTV